MTSHTATVTWTRGDQNFLDRKYSRAHEIKFDGGVTLAGSSAPEVVRVPLSRQDAADPEEMLVASLAMCHMLFFLDLAARAGFVVDRYEDTPLGEMGKDERGRTAMIKATMKPLVTWAGEKRPAAEDIAALHHRAHELCFIANSFRGEVAIEER